MIDKSFSELMSYKYIQLAVALHPIIPSLKKKIDEKEFVIMDAEIFKDMYNSESTFRLVMFAHDIIVSSSKKSFIFRNRVGKDKTPIGWGKTVRKLRKLMKDDVWKKNVEMYHNKNYEICRKKREKIGRALHKDRFRKV